MAKPPKFGNPDLSALLKTLQNQAKRRDATNVRAQPRSAGRREGAVTLGYHLGVPVELAQSYDDVFHSAVQRQRSEWDAAILQARARNANSGFERGRRSAAEYRAFFPDWWK